MTDDHLPLHSKLKRIRPPYPRQLDLTYDLDIDSQKLLPFVVGVLADLSGHPDLPAAPLFKRDFVEIDRDNFDAFFSQISPRLCLNVSNHLPDGNQSLSVELRFREWDDFAPDSLIQQLPFLQELLERRPTLIQSTDPTDVARLIEIDGILTWQVSEIIHHPDFQRLEASWIGLRHLVYHAECGGHLKLRVFNVSKEELVQDSSGEFTQSRLFNKIYTDAFTTLHGEPFGLLIGDYAFNHQPADVRLLMWLAQIAQYSHAPFVAAADCTLFGVDCYREMNADFDFNKVVNGLDHSDWNRFRRSEEACFVGLLLPRVLARQPYQVRGIPGDYHREEGSLWMNAVWAFAAHVTNVYAQHHWFEQLSGLNSVGIVDSLPVCDSKGPLELDLAEGWPEQLAELGLIPLVYCNDSATVSLIRTASCYQRPGDDASNHRCIELNQLLSLLSMIRSLLMMLQYRLSMSTATSLEDCHRYLAIEDRTCAFALDCWLKRYVVLRPPLLASYDKNRYPLADAEVKILPKENTPSEYQLCIKVAMHLSHGQVSPIYRFTSAIPFVPR